MRESLWQPGKNNQEAKSLGFYPPDSEEDESDVDLGGQNLIVIKPRSSFRFHNEDGGGGGGRKRCLQDVPNELLLHIAKQNLSPSDLSNLSRTSKRLHHILMGSHSFLLEHLISTFDKDIVAAYRSISPSFVSISRASSVWGPSVMAACHFRRPFSPPNPSPSSPKETWAAAGPGFKTPSTSSRPKSQRKAFSLRDAYYDLSKIQSWLSDASPLIERTVANFSLYARRRMEAMSTETGAVVLSSSWVAAATVLEFRRKRLEALEEALLTRDFASEWLNSLENKADNETLRQQKEKLEHVKRRVRIHAYRMVVLFFAVAIGAKRDAKITSTPASNTPSVSAVRSPSPTPEPTASITGFSMASSAPNTNLAPPAAVQPDPSLSMALVPANLIPILSQQSVSLWRLLRDLDSDSLTGLAVVLQSTHELLGAKFLASGLEPQRAALHAFHAASLGPKVVGAILRAQSGDNVRELLDMNPSLRPGGGAPFMFNAVLGVLSERGISF
ncbi:hypothetical protein HDU97_002662 [Phlyctochytrium planicorne]|nr:hypothetical protein HDU97_002662 [Phlyctochytrium planicorne]